MCISIPIPLSFLATRDLHGYVPGINDIISGYTNHKGEKELSVEEKIRRGQIAITALKNYRALSPEERKGEEGEVMKANLMLNMPYFGYGYVRNAEDLVPSIPLCFYAFRAMVGLGTLFVLFFITVLFLAFRKDIMRYRWLHWTGVALIPLAWVCSEAGWIVAEMGRQPWTIQDMLPTWVSASDIPASSVMTTFFIFLVIFTCLLVAEINIMVKQIKKGPEL